MWFPLTQPAASCRSEIFIISSPMLPTMFSLSNIFSTVSRIDVQLRQFRPADWGENISINQKFSSIRLQSIWSLARPKHTFL